MTEEAALVATSEDLVVQIGAKGVEGEVARFIEEGQLRGSQNASRRWNVGYEPDRAWPYHPEELKGKTKRSLRDLAEEGVLRTTHANQVVL